MGYDGHQAAPGRRQVRRVRRDRHQRPAEAGRAARRADGVAVRSDRAAEPLGADARPHAAAATCCCSAARTATSRACGSAGRPTSRRSGKSARSSCRRASTPEDLIKIPDNAQYFAALGAVEFGKDEDDDVGVYLGYDEARVVHRRRAASRRRRSAAAAAAWRRRRTSSQPSRSSTSTKKFIPGDVPAGRGGRGLHRPRRRLDLAPRPCCSTRTATSSPRPTSSRRATRSRTRWRCSRELREQVEDAGRDAGGARRRHHRLRQGHPQGRAAAPMPRWSRPSRTPKSALHFYDDVDVIVRRRRPGHQDHHPEERPREGLQAQHAVLGGQRLLPAVDRAGLRLSRSRSSPTSRSRRTAMPSSATAARCSCSRDIVDFQRQGWAPEEIMAGLCNVLPKNIWLYVSQIPNLAKLGTRFVLQGGTQHNLAAVKAQVDFIESRFKGKDVRPKSSSTSTAAKPGPSAPALEAGACGRTAAQTTFIGLDAVPDIDYTHDAQRSHALLLLQEQVPAHLHRCQDRRAVAEQRCRSASRSSRKTEGAARGRRRAAADHRHLREGHGRGRRRHARDQGRASTQIKKAQSELRRDRRARGVPRPRRAEASPTRCRSSQLAPAAQKRARRADEEARRRSASACRACSTCTRTRRSSSAYFESARHPGREPRLLATTPARSCTRKAPSAARSTRASRRKLGIPHVHNLLYRAARQEAARRHLLPDDRLPARPILTHVQGIARVPDGGGHAGSGEGRVHQGRRPVRGEGHQVPRHRSSTSTSRRCSRGRCSTTSSDILGLSRGRERARGRRGLSRRWTPSTTRHARRRRARCSSSSSARTASASCCWRRPYHNDPGLNHEILEEFQKLGYPVFTQDSLPIDDDIAGAAVRRRSRGRATSAIRWRSTTCGRTRY